MDRHVALPSPAPRRLEIGRRWILLALVGAGTLAALVTARPGSAADPSAGPTPIVFARPQYLEFWEGHSTSNGPVVDNAYALFTQPPEADGSLVVPAGDGTVFHYKARLVGGPYADDQALCQQMISLGIKSLAAWPPGQYSPIVSCDAYRPATPVPGASAPGGAGQAGQAGGQAGGPTDEEIDIAAGLIGLLLFGGGLAGLAVAGGTAAGGAVVTAPGVGVSGGPVLMPPPPADLPAVVPLEQPPADRPPSEQPPDPCAGQAAALDAASLRARDVADGLQTARRFQQAMDQEIARLANWTIPMNFGVDVAFLVGGFASKLGPGLIAERLVWKVAEGVAKEVAKSLVKATLGVDDPTLVDLIMKANKGESKAALKEAIKQGLLANAARRGVTGQELARFSEQMAGPMADLFGHTWSVYSTVDSTTGLIGKLNEMRARMLDVHESIAEFELVQRDALDAMQAARHSLDFCRQLNAPGRRW